MFWDWRGATFALIWAVTVTLASSCIRTTPFQSDPTVTGLTQDNLGKLEARRPGPRPFKFAAFGDTHIDYDNLARTVEAINARDDIEFVLIVGDMTTRGLLQEFEWSNDIYSGLDVPYLTVIGNHDTLGNGADIYQRMYGVLDYSFSFGGIKFVLFNSSTLEFEGAAPDREWLLAQVHDQGDSDGIVLVAHHDLTNPTDFPRGDLDQFYQQLVKTDSVVGVVHGHDVPYELTTWHGVPVLQCSTYDQTFLHSIVTVDGLRLSFERCLFDACAPAVPAKDEGDD